MRLFALVSGLILLGSEVRKGAPVPAKCSFPHILLCKSKEVQTVSVRVDKSKACETCNTECNHGPNYTSPFFVTHIDDEMGTIDVKYDKVSDSDDTHMEIELNVNENLDEESCRNSTNLYTDDVCTYALHKRDGFTTYLRSSVLLDLCHTSNTTVCDVRYSDTITFRFNYVFTGCYYFAVRRNRFETVTSCPQYIVTRYKKINLNDLPPLINHQYFSDFRNLRINVHPSRNETKDLIPNFLQVELMNERPTKDMYNGTYDEKNGLIEYSFDNVTQGTYCFAIKYLDDRCTVCKGCSPNESCFWVSIIRTFGDDRDLTSDGRKGEAYRPEIDAHINVLIGIFVIVMIITTITMLNTINSMWKRRKKYIVPSHYRIRYTSPSDQHEKKMKFSPKRILLLYPRDCDLFMLAVAQFRKVLQRANCQVFDYWDPEQREEVAERPNEWVHSLILSVKVIVIASECSELFEKVILGSADADYRRPDAFDRLFLYGIKCLNENTIRNCYDKMFVVRLQEMGDANETGLTYLSPLTLFKLPLHLEKLILSIQNWDPSKHSVILEGIPEVESFKDAIDAFSIYKRENADYLSSLLSIRLKGPIG